MKFIVFAALVLAACPAAYDRSPAAPPEDPGAQLACDSDDQCRPAAATCCECPTYATRVDDPVAAVCDDVDCPATMCEDAVEAVCDPVVGACALRCKPTTCGITCASGYEISDAGCLTCSCAGTNTTTTVCSVDTDCVRTSGDCCGCANGGVDVAIHVADLAAFRDGLAMMCNDITGCPGVDSCDASLQPACVSGACALLPPLPPNACGRSDLPACPTGLTCVLNANDQAQLYGVGTCEPG
jgi:hypothetical protein